MSKGKPLNTFESSNAMNSHTVQQCNAMVHGVAERKWKAWTIKIPPDLFVDYQWQVTRYNKKIIKIDNQILKTYFQSFNAK